eukprot:50335-Chlamydomonas_euryale.AAC.1
MQRAAPPANGAVVGEGRGCKRALVDATEQTQSRTMWVEGRSGLGSGLGSGSVAGWGSGGVQVGFRVGLTGV